MEFTELDIFDCPLCGGAGVLSEAGGWAFTVQCCDCGTETAPAAYDKPSERRQAAEAAVHLWNVGKVIHTGPGD